MTHIPDAAVEAAPAPDAVKIEPVGYVASPAMERLKEQGSVSGCFYVEMSDNYDQPLYGPDAMDRIKELEEIKAEYVEFMKEVEEREETFARMIGDQMDRAEKAEAALNVAGRALTGGQKDG